MSRALAWGPPLAAAAAIALCTATPEPASACSVCLAGDPVFDANGASVGEQGQWNLFLQGSGWKKSSGALPHQEPGGEEEPPHSGVGAGRRAPQRGRTLEPRAVADALRGARLQG